MATKILDGSSRVIVNGKEVEGVIEVIFEHDKTNNRFVAEVEQKIKMKFSACNCKECRAGVENILSQLNIHVDQILATEELEVELLFGKRFAGEVMDEANEIRASSPVAEDGVGIPLILMVIMAKIRREAGIEKVRTVIVEETEIPNIHGPF